MREAVYGVPIPRDRFLLEAPGGRAGVQHRLIRALSDALVERVAPHYSVAIEERVFIIDDEDPEARQQTIQRERVGSD